MKKQRGHRRRNRRFEALEDRAMLAVASLSGPASGKILNITGDDTSETVTITQVGFRQVLVEGTGFAVGGELFSPVDGITVNMKGGDDVVNIGTDGEGSDDPLELFRGLTVELGDGSDTCDVRVNTLGDVKITSTIPRRVTSYNDDDTVIVSDSIMKSLTVTLGVGSDSLTVSQVATLALTANVGVATLKPEQTDSDSVEVLNSAILTATISLGTADAGGSTEESHIAVVVGGQNNVLIDASIFGRLTITGGDKIDNITISSEGEGIGPSIRPMLVDLVDDLENGLAPLIQTLPVQQLINQIDTLLTTFVPEGIDLPFNVSALLSGEADLSETLDEILGSEELSFINTIGDHTIIVLALVVDTKQDHDSVTIVDTLNLGTTTVKTGDGNDTVQIGEGGVSTEDPRDPLELLLKITIELGDGSDDCFVYVNTIGDVVITSAHAANSTNDNDFVVVGDSIMKSLTITTGVGNDDVLINQVATLKLTANVGVARLRSGQVDSDGVTVQDSAILQATITVGTADAGYYEDEEEYSSLVISGQNTVLIDATILGKLTVTGGDRVDSVTISSEGVGIGPNIRPHLVDMVDDIENIVGPVLTALAPSIFNNLDTLLATFVPEGIELPEIDLSEFDLSEALDEFLSGPELGPVLESLGDNTLIVLSASIDTKGDNDGVTVFDTLVLGGCKILTGDGSDDVAVANSQFLGVFPPFNPISNPPLVVQLGNGDDSLTVDTIFALSFKFWGEGGTDDSYTQLGSNFLILGSRTGFEVTTIIAPP